MNQALPTGIYPSLLHHLTQKEDYSTLHCTLIETGERLWFRLWPNQTPLLVMAMQGQPRKPGSVYGTQVDLELGLKTSKRGDSVFNNIIRIHRPAAGYRLLESSVPETVTPIAPEEF